MKKIIILDAATAGIDDEMLNFFKQYGEVEHYFDNKPEDTLALVKDANYLFTDHTRISSEIIESCSDLEYIGIMATGKNAIDIDAAERKGITVTNIPSYSTDSVAQHAFALLLNIVNNLQYKLNYVESGRWNASEGVAYWDDPIIELNGKIVGVIGYGDIAKAFINIASGFGMKILVATKYPDKSAMSENIKFTNLEELLRESDVVSIHKALTDDNIQMIGKNEFEKMKQGVILINTARGKLIDEDALLSALKSGKVKAAGLDTLSKEPPSSDFPLLKQPNCYITAHVGFAGENSLKNLRVGIKEKFKAFVEDAAK